MYKFGAHFALWKTVINSSCENGDRKESDSE